MTLALLGFFTWNYTKLFLNMQNEERKFGGNVTSSFTAQINYL